MPATPERAWEAIATGPGITAWFMPAEVEPRVGETIVHHHEADMHTTGTVIAYDTPHRFAYEEAGWMPEGALAERPIAAEFLVEGRSGGTTVVRVVMSGFDHEEAWEQAIESFTAGWQHALLALRLYLEHFRGQPVASLNAGGVAVGGKDAVWAGLVEALGLPAQPRPGERVSTGDGAPPLAGTVEEAGERIFTLLIDEPAPGLGFVGTQTGGRGLGQRRARSAARLLPQFGADLALLRLVREQRLKAQSAHGKGADVHGEEHSGR